MNPEVTPEATNALAPDTLAEPRGTGETILLVEDEAFVREITGEILESVGFRVLKARTAAEAKTALRRYGKSVQLLLTDLVLPGQNGRELARDLMATNSGLRVIFISGYPGIMLARNCTGERRTSYLAKPFSAESLLRQISRALAQEGEQTAV